MNNKNVKITVTKEKDAITVNATIPEMNPRKEINFIRYDVVDAQRDAIAEYGQLVGPLRTWAPNPVLENKNRASGNTLEGTWVFEINQPDTTAPNRKPSRRRTRTKTTTSEQSI